MFEGNFFNRQTLESIYFAIMDKPLQQWKCFGFNDPFDDQKRIRIEIDNLKQPLAYFVIGLIFSTFTFLSEIISSRLGFRFWRIISILELNTLHVLSTLVQAFEGQN